MIKSLLALLIAVIIGVGIMGAYYFPKVKNSLGATPVGNTFNDQKMAAITFSPSSGTATSTSILNPAGQDVYVTDNFAGCANATTTYTAYTGTGLANWLIKAATTSTSAPLNVANTNLVMNDIIATGTSIAGGTPFAINLVASTSIATTSSALNGNVGTAAYQFLWAANTYLTFFSNATNTATCTVGVHYFSS